MRPRLFIAGALAFAAGGAGLLGCASQRAQFVPPATPAVSVRGQPAALYRLKAVEEDWGQVRVWSPGFEAPPPDSRPARPDPWIAIGFTINNESLKMLKMDLRRTQIHLARSPGQILGLVRPVVAAPVSEVYPGREAEVAVFFQLPPDVRTDEIAAFRVVWAIDHESSSYLQATTFVRDQPGPDRRGSQEALRSLEPRFVPYGWRPGFDFEGFDQQP